LGRDFGDVGILDQPGRLVGAIGIQEQVLAGVAGVDPADAGALTEHGADHRGQAAFQFRLLDGGDLLVGQVVDGEILHHLDPNVEFRAVAGDQTGHAFAGIDDLLQRPEDMIEGKFVVNFVDFLAADGHPAGAVVGKGHDQGLAVTPGKIKGGPDRFVVGQQVADHACRIVVMRGPVHFAGFDEQEEALLVFRQGADGGAGHFRQRGFGWGEVFAVEIISQRVRGEQAPGPAAVEREQFVAVPEQRNAVGLQNFGQVLTVGPHSAALLGQQVLQTAAEHDVDVSVDLLLGDQRVAVTEGGVSGKGGRTGMLDLAGGDQADGFPHQTGAFQNGGCRFKLIRFGDGRYAGHGRFFRQDAQKLGVGLMPGREGCRCRGRVGDQRFGAVGAQAADEDVVEGQRRALVPAGQGEVGGRGAVGHQQDDVFGGGGPDRNGKQETDEQGGQEEPTEGALLVFLHDYPSRF